MTSSPYIPLFFLVWKKTKVLSSLSSARKDDCKVLKNNNLADDSNYEKYCHLTVINCHQHTLTDPNKRNYRSIFGCGNFFQSGLLGSEFG